MAEITRLGRIEITPTAISSIASQAVLECYGVVGMASPHLRDGIYELLHRDNQKRGVSVKIIDQEIIIDLYVILEYGLRISTVVENIMSTVKFSVEKVLGVPVAQVNVHVQGLRVSEPG
ncbi:MAG: Asp23/Gls24 family envelope stress response protein [Anaerolineae bacterium]